MRVLIYFLLLASTKIYATAEADLLRAKPALSAFANGCRRHSLELDVRRYELHKIRPRSISYELQLMGKDISGSSCSAQRKVRFSRLFPAKYLFQHLDSNNEVGRCFHRELTAKSITSLRHLLRPENIVYSFAAVPSPGELDDMCQQYEYRFYLKDGIYLRINFNYLPEF